MKRVLPLLLVTILVMFLSACGKRSELVCDSCGVSFLGDGDYSEELERDAEIQEALGIDLYGFFCPDCRPEHTSGISAYGMSEEDLERLEAYDRGETLPPTSNINDDVTIIGSTGMEPYYIAEDHTSGLNGIYDTDAGEWKTDPMFSTIYPYDTNGMALAERDGYYGYIDQTGVTIIGFQFADALSFNELGLATVKMNQVGVINRAGDFLIDPMYEKITYRNNFIQVYDGRHFGLYNLEGDMIIDPTYNEEFVFEGDYIYANKSNRWYAVFDQNGNSMLSSLRGVMKKDAAISPRIGENEIVDGVSLPVNGILICSYADSTLQYYRLFDTEFNLLQEQDYAYISPFNSLGYAAAVPCEFKKNEYGNLHMTDQGDWILIGQDGSHYRDLPDMSELYQGGDSVFGNKYLYANDYYAYADWSGETLVNISNGEVSKWKTVTPVEGTQCIIAQDLQTDLWSLLDQDTLAASNCTEITYDPSCDSFTLTRGGESETYTPLT